jgi:2-polyprenyl-3-methyl-5-hydroxy-6-metoxy-1,4-benzoquinol methylase
MTQAQMQTPQAYEAFYQGLGDQEVHQRVHWGPVRMRYFLPDEGSDILELGCGTGGNCIIYALKKHCRCVGVELSQGMVDAGMRAVNEDYPGISGQVQLHQGWIEDWHETTARYDYVLVTEVLEHVLDPVAILRVACEHLAPGGMVYISAPAVRVGGESHVRGVTWDDLESWLADAGLVATWHTEQPNRLKGESYPQTVCKAEAKEAPCAS